MPVQTFRKRDQISVRFCSPLGCFSSGNHSIFFAESQVSSVKRLFGLDMPVAVATKIHVVVLRANLFQYCTVVQKFKELVIVQFTFEKSGYGCETQYKPTK